MDVRPAPDSVTRSLPGSDDTIVAVATAQGRGALAIIRLGGARAFEIAQAIVSSWPDAPRRVTLSLIRDPHTEALLDEALVVRYEGPHSYTGEDLVELTTHGGSLVPSTIVAALIEQGARQAKIGRAHV